MKNPSKKKGLNGRRTKTPKRQAPKRTEKTETVNAKKKKKMNIYVSYFKRICSPSCAAAGGPRLLGLEPRNEALQLARQQLAVAAADPRASVAWVAKKDAG